MVSWSVMSYSVATPPTLLQRIIIIFIRNKFLSILGLGVSKQNIAPPTTAISDKPQVVTVTTTLKLSLLSANATIASFNGFKRSFCRQRVRMTPNTFTAGLKEA